MIMGRKRREYSYDDWKKAMELHNKYKLGPTKISRILGIDESTINNWLYYGVVPLTAKWVAKPNNELAYVIGTAQGDACVSKSKDNSWYKYVIILYAIDKEFAITFSRAMSRLLNKKYIEPRWDEKRKKWRVEYYSKAFYEWYKKCEEQGLQGFKPYIEYNKETVKHYLRGLYDSEGFNKRNKQIRLYNIKKQLLEYIQCLLEKYFDIKATGPYLMYKAGTQTVINGIKTRYNHDYYEIDISRKEHVRRFLKEIGFSIIRKQLGLKKDEKVFVEGKYVEPYELVKLGLFRLPFSNNQ